MNVDIVLARMIMRSHANEIADGIDAVRAQTGEGARFCVITASVVAPTSSVNVSHRDDVIEVLREAVPDTEIPVAPPGKITVAIWHRPTSEQAAQGAVVSVSFFDVDVGLDEVERAESGPENDSEQLFEAGACGYDALASDVEALRVATGSDRQTVQVFGSDGSRLRYYVLRLDLYDVVLRRATRSERAEGLKYVAARRGAKSGTAIVKRLKNEDTRISELLRQVDEQFSKEAWVS